MKTLSKTGIWILFFGLMIGNIYVFITGVTLSDRIHTYENEISKLRQENIVLETKVFKHESITYAASVAADLEYTKQAEPVFFDTTANKYALNR